jgi:hypothetical protein
MYFILRTHVVSADISKESILRKYTTELDRTGVLMSTWDMNWWIRKTFSHRSSTVRDVTVVVEIDDYETFLESGKHESIVDAWVSRKPGDGFHPLYRETRYIKQCKICLTIKGCLVQMNSCDCMFHKECITQAVKYSPQCPLCKTPIKACE